jgi:hypothetical protein
VGNVARVGETRNAYRVLVGKPDGNRPLGRYICIREKIILKSIKRIRIGEPGLD